MGGLKTLVAMQIKDKIDMSFIKTFKSAIFKIVLSILKFVVITAIIYLAFYLLDYLRLVSLLPGVPQSFMSIIVTIMFILSVVVCTFGLIKSLYQSKDNALLLTMPVGKTTVFVSKMIVYYLYELIRNITFFLPLFIAYAMINKMALVFYIWLIFAMLILTALPVCIGALLSIPLVFIVNFIKSYRAIEVTFVIAVIGAVVALLVMIISAIPANFDLLGSWGTTYWEIQSFMVNFNQAMQPFTWITTAVLGIRYGITNTLFGSEQILILLGMVGFIIAVLGLTFLLVRPLFFKMASSPFEYKKVKIKKEFKNKHKNTFWSSVSKEFTIIVRTPNKALSLLAVAIGLPIAIFLLNKIYSAMDTRLAGTYMTIAFNILIILLVMLSSSTPLAHTFSEEGASSYLNKTIPNPYIKSLTSKLVINFVVMTISLAVSVAIFISFINYTIWQAIQIFVALEIIFVAHMLWTAELDLMNPQTGQYQTTGTHVNDPNETRSTIYAFLLSALFAFLTYFFIIESLVNVWGKIMFIAGLFLLFRIWMYVNKIKVYYKEK